MSLLKTVVVAGTALAMSAAYARAADMPEFLRGSTAPSYTRWEGFYFGAQAGKTFGSADFGNATIPWSATYCQHGVAGYRLQLYDIAERFDRQRSYGGFVGYNWQWADVVLGGELNYNHMSIGRRSGFARADPGSGCQPPRRLDGPLQRHSDIAARVDPRHRDGARARRLDLRPLHALCAGRGRPADVALCNFGGSTKTTTPPAPGAPTTGALILPRDPQTQAQDGEVIYGFTAGLGIEAELMHNVFARAEWEFIQFPNVADFACQRTRRASPSG